MSSFYTIAELAKIGFKRIGNNVSISKFSRIYFPQKISIGNNVRIDDFCFISGGVQSDGYIQLGDFIHIGAYCGLWGGGGIVFDDYTNTSPGTKIFSVTTNIEDSTIIEAFNSYKKRSLSIGTVYLNKYVNLGSNTVIMPGINIGEGTIICANSFVNKDCEKWKIYVGSPAKIIAKRPIIN